MDKELEQLAGQGLLRRLKTSRRSGKFIEVEGRRFLDFGSNDYLGISERGDLQREFLDSLDDEESFLFGSAASRLLTGNHEDYDSAESVIAAEYGRPCLILNSGYHANTGLIPSIAQKGDLILCDKLSHASIIDALKLTESKWMRFAHNDMEHLRSLLREHRANHKRVLVVSESVFSMDGDFAPLKELVQIKNEFDALLYIDEAHGVGVFGDRGLGLSEECGLLEDVDFIMCTLGKALAAEGAFVISSSRWREMFVNRTRSLIFTTALPPVNLRWIKFAFMRALEMRGERVRLKALGARFRSELSELEVLGESQIAPLVIGDSKKAMLASEQYAAAGIWAPAVRWPTVPINSARIRFSLSASMDFDDVDFCARTILATK